MLGIYETFLVFLILMFVTGIVGRMLWRSKCEREIGLVAGGFAVVSALVTISAAFAVLAAEPTSPFPMQRSKLHMVGLLAACVALGLSLLAFGLLACLRSGRRKGTSLI